LTHTVQRSLLWITILTELCIKYNCACDNDSLLHLSHYVGLPNDNKMTEN